MDREAHVRTPEKMPACTLLVREPHNNTSKPDEFMAHREQVLFMCVDAGVHVALHSGHCLIIGFSNYGIWQLNLHLLHPREVAAPCSISRRLGATCGSRIRPPHAARISDICRDLFYRIMQKRSPVRANRSHRCATK